MNPAPFNWDDDLNAARQGDRRALGHLLQTYWPALWRLASHSLDPRLASKHSPSDAIQETFVDAQQSIGDFRGQSPVEFQAWLKSILTRNMADARRRFVVAQKRDANLELPLDPDLLEEHPLLLRNDSPSAALKGEEMRVGVEQAMERLPANYQQVLRLRYWEHRSFVEIGQMMGKSADSVRQIWYRAIEHFSRIVDDQHH